MGELFLIPNTLSEGNWQNVLPEGISEALASTGHFIVENIRTARRFIKQINPETDIDKLKFYELNKYTLSGSLPEYLKPLELGENMAVISEAGCPGVADPGAEIVRFAHQKGIRVVPFVGPSSILLALMASGLNGQNFAFNGYLPIKPKERTDSIVKMEKQAKNSGQTQIFIETPYRNNQLVEALLKACSPGILLCIAANLTGENEFISTKTISQWASSLPDLHKQPAIFLIGR